VVEDLPTRFERFLIFLKPPALLEVIHFTNITGTSSALFLPVKYMLVN